LSSARFRVIAGLAAALIAVLLLAVVLGSGGGDSGGNSSSEPTTTTPPVVVQTADNGFNVGQIYRDIAPGVVTIYSIYGGTGDSASILGGGGGGQGSGFVISKEGEIVTNAHVVTHGGEQNGGGQPKAADQVFVQFADHNRVPADIKGFDPDGDVALIKVDPDGLDLKPVPISDRETYTVGEPVAAIGSPFGEEQSLSTGIVSATDRSIPSLSQFSIDNAIQTDASINPGNSGGPLIDANGEVIGINQQIESNSGSNSGVGFAIPSTAIRYSLEQLREDGQVEYAYLGVSTQPVWPQLNDEFNLGADTGALISSVVDGGPADDAGLKGGDKQDTFQGFPVDTGGDLIVAIDGHKLEHESDLAELVSRQRPGDTVSIEYIRDGDHHTTDVKLDARPDHVSNG
jgi:S1-C subfamily serine protease